MRSTFGQLIRKKREFKQLTREQLARKLRISSGFLAHLEIGTPVHLSYNLADKIRKRLNIRGAVYQPMVESQRRATSRHKKRLKSA